MALESSSIAHQSLGRDLKSVILRHFSQTYYGLLLNPNSDLAFYDVWSNDLQKLIVASNSLEYAMLANAASHMHFVDGSSQMQELALTYYSKATKGLAETLASAARRQDHDAILMSVMLLYLHGVSHPKISLRLVLLSYNRLCLGQKCFGRGTYNDIPWHLNAATQIIKVRYLHDLSFVVTRPYDRLAIESVLYQVFLVTTGCW